MNILGVSMGDKEVLCILNCVVYFKCVIYFIFLERDGNRGPWPASVILIGLDWKGNDIVISMFERMKYQLYTPAYSDVDHSCYMCVNKCAYL